MRRVGPLTWRRLASSAPCSRVPDMRRHPYGLIPIVVLCGHVGMSAAQPAENPISLSWEVPDGSECSSAEVVSAEIERLLGGKPSATTSRRVIARARVLRNDDGSWTLDMRTTIAKEDADGERLLHAGSCAELGSAAALIIALGFDPAAVAAQAERTREQPAQVVDKSEEVAPKAPNTPSKQPPAPPPVVGVSPAGKPGASLGPENSAKVRLGLNVGAGGDVGSFSGPTLSLHLSGRLRYRKLELVASATYFPPHRTPLPARPAAGGLFSLMTGEFLACGPLFSWRVLELGACGGAELGQMRADGYGVRKPSTASALWFAPRAEGTLFTALTATLGLRFEVGVAVPLTQNRFVLEQKVVEEPAAIAGRVDVGVEYHF